MSKINIYSKAGFSRFKMLLFSDNEIIPKDPKIFL